jgi:hypothetical protein
MTEGSTAGQLVVRGGSINGVSYDAIAGSATCQLFAAGAGIAANIAVGSAITGNIWGVVGGGAGLLGANALAAANGCFPVNPDPGPSSGGNGIAEGQCMETETCDLMLIRRGGEGGQYVTVKKLISSVASGTYPNGAAKATTTWINCAGETESDDEAQEDLWPIVTQVMNGATCVGGPSGPPSNPLPDPVPVPDPDGGPCTFNTQLIDSYINAAGGMSILYETCATGPGCSGCSRFWYHGPGNTQPAPPEPIPGPDGEPLPQPNPEGPGGDCPDPCPPPEPCRFEPCSPPEATITARNFLFTSACGENEDGTKAQATYNLQGASDLKGCFDALAAQNGQIMTMLQQHLLWKTPTCPEETPELEGEFRTISFRSDETSPYGKSRLRKRLRYRSRSGIGLGELVDYWKDFTFIGGPVRVRHVGSSWGTVEVWAITEDEGKRVILHAAGEAGIDPNQVGRWSTRRSDSSRLGVSLPMRVDKTGGYYWITARDGSDNRPIVAT